MSKSPNRAGSRPVRAKSPVVRKLHKGRARDRHRRADEHGPIAWLLPELETLYLPLTPRGSAASGAPLAISHVQAPDTALATLAPATHWRDTILEYRSRKAQALGAAAPATAMALASVPGSRNWNPLGPSVVINGQTVDNQPVGGRVAGLAVAPGGSVLYAASANGGVFRSDDGATSWRSLMDRFALDPTNFASASLICGAIAVAPSRPQRVYVGTGEGDTQALFQKRVTDALPAYRGVGPVSSDDGGVTWAAEPSAPDLAGAAFFSIAVDSTNADIAIGGTTQGLYLRGAAPGGQFQWQQIKPGMFSSVVFVTNAGIRRFYCAQWDDSGAQAGVIYSDDDGATWAAAGGAFPAGAGRIELGVQSDNTDVVYAFVAKTNGSLLGVYRLDAIAGPWNAIAGPPAVLSSSQGQYDLAIAVDPQDINTIYLAGDAINVSPYSGSIWRCVVQSAASAYSFSSTTSIGTHAHADVHCLTHTPGDPTELWATTDGGVFLNRDPKGTGEFAGQNNGLACLCCNFLGQHPTDPNILIVGLQDNGTARTAAGPIWTHVNGGDGGYCLVNWANPNNVLSYANGTLYSATDGGLGQSSWSVAWDYGWFSMTQPVEGPPYDPANPANADIVAIGAGPQVYISQDFAATWPTILDLSTSGATGAVFALAWANTSRLFASTTTGEVFRLDAGAGGGWAVTEIDNAAAGPLGLAQLITDIEIDWADASGGSIYVGFAGMGDRRRVWHFDGTSWSDRSGAAGPLGLLDVECNALAVDPAAPQTIYVGMDIGAWCSTDSGQTWNPLANGLPEAPVYDLQIHPTQRLLRASLYGRGVYELPL